MFLLTKPTPKKLRLEAGPRVEEMETSPTPKKVTFASRSLWAGISSPIDDTATPISAKTPGLTTCANAHCPFKVVPSFETRVCTECMDSLRGTVDNLLVQIDPHDPNAEKGTQSATPHQAASHPSPPFPTHNDPATGPALFAVPSTPPSTRLLITHSLATPPKQDAHTNVPPSLDQPLFALPNTSLDTAYEDFTPTTRYTMHFPALPARSRNLSSNNDSNSNDINNDSSSSKTSPPGPNRSSVEQHSAHRAPTNDRRSSPPCTKAFDKVYFSRRFDWGADWNRRLRDGKGWAKCLKITEALRDGM
ncbi:hypothetical protein EJ07DRAFT_176426 [Lizonia empirigonia]|nr:hypothetical protein EJ07DRAFT_176426 [Lizonia empirigonia]